MRKIVEEYLENISGETIEKYQNIIKKFIKGKNGVYALYNNDKLVYVGLATNLLSRLKTHLRDRHKNKWNSFSVYLTKSDKYLRELEALIIRIADPKNNKQKGKLPGSKNLKKEMKKEINEYFNDVKMQLLGSIDKKKSDVKKNRGNKNSPNQLSFYVKKRFKIKLKYKGKEYFAVVHKNGKIQYNGKLYNSPSQAALVISKRNVNGWNVWKFKNKRGEWVKLDELRR